MVKKQNGLTIIQLMVVLLVAGIIGSLAVNAIIDYRCKNNPTASICARNQNHAPGDKPAS
jgi:Tfp pilus assembly protein PilE